MKIRDRAWFTLLAMFGAFIWLRDRAWVASASETLPILAALPLFIWFGSPWRLPETRFRLDPAAIAASGLLLLAGLAADSTFLLAAAWTVALWSWLRGRSAEQPIVSPRLLLLPMMAFPWVSLDLERLGWWFRLSAAWSTEHLFAATGLAVTRHGTNLLVQGQPIDVTPACSGMHSLQAYLIAGILIAFIEQKPAPVRDGKVPTLPSSDSFLLENAFWISIATIPPLAWIANVIRVSTLTAAALTWGDDFARGWFHGIGGWFAVAIPFLCWWGILRTVKTFLPQPDPTNPEPQPDTAGSPPTTTRTPIASPTRILASIDPQWAILAFCIWQASDLVIAWSHSPFDSFGWLALLLWLTPQADRLIRRYVAGSNPLWRSQMEQPDSLPPVPLALWAALLACFLGILTDLHFLKHCALALACAGITSRFRFWLPWFLLSISWMPALGWVLAALHPVAVTSIRLTLAALAALLPLYGAWTAPRRTAP